MSTPIKGKVNIIVKAIKKAIVKKLKIGLIFVCAFVLIIGAIAGFFKHTEEENTKTIQNDLYKSLGLEDGQDLSSLVEIRGDDKKGYYLTFVDNIDERLEKVLKDNKNIYENIGITDVDILKTFIKAQVVTDFPSLEGAKGGGNINVPDFYGGIMDIPRMFQADPAWAGSHYPNHPSSKISNNGCGQTSVAMVISYLTGTEVTPVEVAQWCDDPKFANAYFNGIGSNGPFFAAAAEHWDVGTVTETSNSDEMTDALLAGKPVISFQRKGLFTRGQHFIVLTGVDDTGKIHVNDPASEARSNVAYTLSQVDSTNITYYIYEGGNLADNTDVDGIDKEEKFQGAIKIRRVTPNKNIGEYKELAGATTNIDNEGITSEGLGKKQSLPENIRNKIIQNSNIPEDAQNILDNLSYLTIPYVNFEGKIKNGHMIVNENMADEILRIFQELYNIKYPIEKMEIVDTYERIEGKDLQYSAIDDNNTFSFYYGDASLHLTGNAIDLNPKINPQVENGQTQHTNASRYINRENKDKWSQEAQAAYIDKDTEVYKIFEKYGWTWGGNDSNSPDYKHFEKTTQTEENTETTTINSKVYDLRYVPEETFNKYVEGNSSLALKFFTLNEDKEVITATWSYTSEGGIKISKAKAIDYKKVLSKYNMPIEYLLAMAVYSSDTVFCEGLANLAIESEYIVAIEDKVTTTQTVKDSTEIIKLISDTKGYVKTLDSNNNQEISVSESVNQEVEVTYVDSWFVKFAKDYSYSTEYLKGAEGRNGTVNLSGKAGDYIGDFQITAYCSCGKCCGKYSPENGGAGTTASGTIPQAGLTVASNILPQGSYIMFNEHVYLVEDTGSGLSGNWIDLYMNSHQEALNWGVKTFPVYWAKDVDESSKGESSKNNTGAVSVSIDAMGKFTDSTTSYPETSSYDSEYSVAGYYLSITKSTLTTVGTYVYEYDTGNSEISGNSQKFVDLYKSEECKKVRDTYVPWLLEALEENSKTANMIEITEYLFSQATGENFGKNSTLKFSEYEPGSFEDIKSSSSSDILLDYIKSWENSALWKYQEGKVGYGSYVGRFITEDKTQYKCFTDGANRRNFSFGVCHYNGKGTYWHTQEFGEYGIDITQYYEIGTMINVDIVDGVMQKLIEGKLENVKSKAQQAGITLEVYQMHALVAISYQYGDSIINRFVSAYQQYGDTEQLRQNFTSSGGYKPFLTGYSKEGEAYEKQRANANWTLFHEGRYLTSDGGELDPSDYSVSGGEFLEVAKKIWVEICTSGRFTAYGGSQIPCTGPTVDCSAYVSWVLYEYGYTEFAGWQKDTRAFLNTNWNQKYGWEEISVGSGENPYEILQPGDLFVRVGGDTHHITLIVEKKDGKIYSYDCGSINNWKNNPGNPVDRSYFLTKVGTGKIIRVTPPK